MIITKRLPQYLYLIRFHKPIGSLLLLWPTLWALWLASKGIPDVKILSIFITGVFVTRSAGCIVSDIFDRRFDAQVKRTCDRPLASNKVSLVEALILLIFLSITAFVLVLFCNRLTIELAFFGAAITILYPLLKRVTHLPQVGLGVAYTWGIPMGFAAVTANVGRNGWILFAATILWPIIFDTFYAMVDRDDDCKIGVKSTAILFGKADLFVILLLQFVFTIALVIVGYIFNLRPVYFIAIGGVLILFFYQLYLSKNRDRDLCFKAFLNNNWVGLLVFLGIWLSYV